MIVIGIDPGSVTGYGVVKVLETGYALIDYGCIRPPRSSKLSEKRQIIFEGLSHLMSTHQPQAVSVETQFLQHNIQSAIKLGMVRSIAILAASLQGIPVFEYSPTRAKKSVVGNGQASKRQVQHMMQLLFNLDAPPTPDDAADALALALCHIHASQGPHFVANEV